MYILDLVLHQYQFFQYTVFEQWLVLLQPERLCKGMTPEQPNLIIQLLFTWSVEFSCNGASQRADLWNTFNHRLFWQ